MKLSSQRWLLGLPTKGPYMVTKTFDSFESAGDFIFNQGLIHQKIFYGETLKPIKAYFIDKDI